MKPADIADTCAVGPKAHTTQGPLLRKQHKITNTKLGMTTNTEKEKRNNKL